MTTIISRWAQWLWSAYGADMLIVSLTLASMKQQNPSTQLAITAGAVVAGGLASFVLAGTSNMVLSMGLVAVIEREPYIFGL